MVQPCIVISSELNLHREVLLGTLRAQRPHLRVQAVAPMNLAVTTECTESRLLICSDPEVVHRERPNAWILLYPDGENLMHVSIGDAHRTLFNVTIHELIAVIDEACATVMRRPE